MLNMKKFFSSLPNDIKQTLSSLAIASALLCGSLLMLSAYMDSIRAENPDTDVMATIEQESSSQPD